VVARFNRQTGFAGRPLALRRTVLEILRRRDMLTAHDIAGCAFGHRLVVRPGHRRHVTTSQLVSVRKALRALVAKGRVEVLYRRRHWKIFRLRQESEQ
jgi:hypothetical protein